MLHWGLFLYLTVEETFTFGPPLRAPAEVGVYEPTMSG